MKHILKLLLLMALAGFANAQTIDSRVLVSGKPLKIILHPAVDTTLFFPAPINGVFGLGLVAMDNGQQNGAAGVIAIQHPAGAPLLVFHPLKEPARVLATILMEGKLYVLDLQTGGSPDVAITLIKEGSSAVAGREVKEVTPKEIKDRRPKYDDERLIGFWRRAHDAALLKPLYPDLFKGYSTRPAAYTSESDSAKTTVTTVHRFSEEDAVVLEGTLQNKSDHPINFDGRSVAVRVANEVHPSKLTYVLRPVPVGATVPLVVVIQGDTDGVSRANLALENEYRIELPPLEGERPTVWSVKNGQQPLEAFPIPKPSASPPAKDVSPKVP